MRKIFIGCVIGCVFVLSLAPGIALAQEAKRYKLTEQSWQAIQGDKSIPPALPPKLEALVDNEYATEGKFRSALEAVLGSNQEQSIQQILQYTEKLGIDMGSIIDILVKFLVLAVVFEMALTPIFGWRLFRSNLNHKGFKVPITIVLALLVFWNFKLDIFQELMDALYGTETPISFIKLGIRNPYSSRPYPYSETPS